VAKVILLFSLARQGHHAVINWICRQSPNSRYHNNCRIDSGTVKLPPKQCYKFGGDDSDLIIYNFVNLDITEHWHMHHRLGVKDPIYCVVVRDPYNCISSLAKGGMRKIPSKINNWKNLVETALGDHPVPKGIKFVDINFNKWFLHEIYREKLASRLGLEFLDTDLGDHDKIGKSSFQPNEKTGYTLDVMYRWKYYNGEAKLWRHLNEEVIDLGKRYFNFHINKHTHEVLQCNNKLKY